MIETALYAAGTVQYVILYRLMFGRKLKRHWAAVLLGILFAAAFVVLWPEFDEAGKGAICRLLSVAAIAVMQEEKWKKRGSDTLVLWLVSMVLEKLLATPLQLLDVYVPIEEQWGDVLNVIVSLLVSAGLFLLYKRKQKYAEKEPIKLSTKKIYVLVLFMVVEMLFTASGFQFASSYVPVKWFPAVAVVLTTFSYLAIGLLGVFVVHIRRVNEQLDEMLQSEVMLKKTQQAYYEALLEKEEETRQYRHDMVGHFICLNAFAEEHKIEELQKYLQTLQQQFAQIQNKCCMTGNTVLDAITNHYLLELDSGITVQVKGQLHCAPAVDDVTLCTIYDNLLKNAVEELARITEGKKQLRITFSQGENVCEIKIQNSMAAESKKKRALLFTEKEDKRSHGLGLKNVNRAVLECGGSLKLHQEGEFFTACFRAKNRKI